MSFKNRGVMHKSFNEHNSPTMTPEEVSKIEPKEILPIIEKEVKKKIFTSIFTKAYTNIVSNNENIQKSELKHYKADLTKSTPEQNFKYSPYYIFLFSYLAFIIFIVMYHLIK